jgi:hypothetical protein
MHLGTVMLAASQLVTVRKVTMSSGHKASFQFNCCSERDSRAIVTTPPLRRSFVLG